MANATVPYNIRLWPDDTITAVVVMFHNGYQPCQAIYLSPVEYAVEVESYGKADEAESLYEYIADKITAINLGHMAVECKWDPPL